MREDVEDMPGVSGREDVMSSSTSDDGYHSLGYVANLGVDCGGM